MKTFIYISIFLTLLSGCSISRFNNSWSQNIVLKKGDRVIASSNIGVIEIFSNSLRERTFTWDGESRSVKMRPRKEEWFGKKGLYFPGIGNHWEDHNGITRGIIEESKLYFSSVDEALRFLQHSSRKNLIVYNDKGLAVTWNKLPNPSGGKGGVLRIELWKVFINNQEPNSLPGSNNSAVVFIRRAEDLKD